MGWMPSQSAFEEEEGQFLEKGQKRRKGQNKQRFCLEVMVLAATKSQQILLQGELVPPGLLRTPPHNFSRQQQNTTRRGHDVGEQSL